MYGAVLRPWTELTKTKEAHMGVLFLTNEGYSTMCGHATLAVSRLLVDAAGAGSSDLHSVDEANKLVFDEDNECVGVRLHCPCGLVHVTVPAIRIGPEQWKTDISRPISYLSIPSYATGISVKLDLPSEYTWPELANKSGQPGSVVVDIAYGGAFYIFAPATALGFASLAIADLQALNEATRKLKAAFNRPEASGLREKYLRHPEHADLQFLYSVFITDVGEKSGQSDTTETGLCFFANQQIDRSPTGSGVQARVALAYAKGQRKLGEQWTYHSFVSKAFGGEGAFVGEPVKEVDVGDGIRGVTVRVSGYVCNGVSLFSKRSTAVSLSCAPVLVLYLVPWIKPFVDHLIRRYARYTGCCNFVVEDGDRIGQGFWFDELKGSV